MCVCVCDVIDTCEKGMKTIFSIVLDFYGRIELRIGLSILELTNQKSLCLEIQKPRFSS